MKRFFFAIAVALMFAGCSRSVSVQSPDKSMVVSFRLTEAGAPEFAVESHQQTVIDWSPMGLMTEDVDLSQGFTLVNTLLSSSDETWETVWGEERFIRDHHNELTVSLRHESGLLMNVVFRVFDDGFAFRYAFPEQAQQQLTITDERTAYRFVADHEAWSIPWRTDYYEGLWSKSPLSQKTDTLCSPITLELADGGFAFVHEASLTDYPAQNLYMHNGALCVYLTPWLGRYVEGTTVEIKAYENVPFATPWRMVILTKTLPELVASRVMLNLNEPCKLDDTSWIKPMKFMGIWWGMHIKTMTWEQGPKHGATTKNMERYLRFAKEHGIQAVLAEGWNKGWEDWQHFSFTEPYPDWNMDYLSNLANELGVQIVGHNETGGNAADYETVLDEAYTYHQKHGIHAIKTGYVAPIIRTVDGLQWNKGQSGVRHYRKVIETAAKYHITIDNHEPVMPTGLQRTYPNLMSQEGVRGQEWNAWSSDGGSPCEHVTVLPFTRIMAGPVDYTPGVFKFEYTEMPSRPMEEYFVQHPDKAPKTPRVHSTLMNQLGLFVCFYSPLQMVCDLPEHYMEHLDAFRFIEQVPCDWERSLLVDGKIGDYCVFARQGRGSNKWYIGGITDEQARTVQVPLSMLDEGEYTLTLWRDAEDADWQTRPYAYDIKEQKVTKADTLTIRMAAGGGFAATIY